MGIDPSTYGLRATICCHRRVADDDTVGVDEVSAADAVSTWRPRAVTWTAETTPPVGE